MVKIRIDIFLILVENGIGPKENILQSWPKWEPIFTGFGRIDTFLISVEKGFTPINHRARTRPAFAALSKRLYIVRIHTLYTPCRVRYCYVHTQTETVPRTCARSVRVLCNINGVTRPAQCGRRSTHHTLLLSGRWEGGC